MTARRSKGGGLTEFLLARIAEDESAARLGAGEPAYPHYGDTAAEECVNMAKSEGCAADGYRHLRRHLPARVLAECEAKRQIVGRYVAGGPPNAYDLALLDVMRDLATIYADHPDYREEWKP